MSSPTKRRIQKDKKKKKIVEEPLLPNIIEQPPASELYYVNSKKKKHDMLLQLPSLPGGINALNRVECKITKARAEERKFLQKLENLKAKSNMPPKLFEPSLNHFEKLPAITAINDPEKIKDVKARRLKILEDEQIKKNEKYVSKHENRKARISVVKCFELARRKRFFLQAVFAFKIFNHILSHKHSSQSGLGKVYLQQQIQNCRILNAKQILLEFKKGRKNARKSIASLHRLLLLFLVRWRLKRRKMAAMLLTDFLRKVKFSTGNFRALFMQVKKAAQKLQRNFRALKPCKDARLYAMQLKVTRVYQTLKKEAEDYWRKKYKMGLGYYDGQKLIHPKNGLDMKLTIEGETLLGMLRMLIEMKKKEWIARIDRIRKGNQQLDSQVVREWLVGETKAATKVHNIVTLVGSQKQRYPFSSFRIYSTTTIDDVVKIIHSVFKAKYPSQAPQEKKHRKKLHQKANDISVVIEEKCFS